MVYFDLFSVWGGFIFVSYLIIFIGGWSRIIGFVLSTAWF